MKITITLIFFLSALTFGQSVSDSISKDKNAQDQEQMQNQQGEMKQYQNQIGPQKNPEAAVKGNRKNKDVFIDKDGDGICDTRQSGMSFNKMRKRMGSGQKGPGKGQHGPKSGSGNGNQFGNGNGGNN